MRDKQSDERKKHEKLSSASTVEYVAAQPIQQHSGNPASTGRQDWNEVINVIADELQEKANMTVISQFTALCEEFDRRAPVAAPELDVEAERREFEAEFPVPEGVEWNGARGEPWYVSRYRVPEAVEYNLQWGAWRKCAARTAATSTQAG